MGKRLEEVDAHYKLQGLSKNCLHSSALCDTNFYQIYKLFFDTFPGQTKTQSYVIE